MADLSLAGGVSSSLLPRLHAEEVLPLTSLLSNWTRRTQSALHDVLESSAASDEHKRRLQLFQWITARARQLGQLYGIVHWSRENDEFLQRMRFLTQLLQQRQSMFQSTVDTMHILTRRVEDTLYPMWDVLSAVHVLSSGTYRLLPEIIETRLVEEHQASAAAGAAAAVAGDNLKPPITEDLISSTVARLNTTLHMHLLSTPLPHALTHISVRDGMAYLTFGEEFELGVSLRMGPATQQQPQITSGADEDREAQARRQSEEEARISWRLFHLRILMNVESHASVAADAPANTPPTPLLNESQILHLIVLLNHISFEQPNPLLIFYDTLHSLLLGIVMDIVHSQSVNLTRLFGMHDTQVEYAQATKMINIYYWKEVRDMPLGMEGASNATREITAQPIAPAPSKKLLSPCLQILVDERCRLSIRHNPPLPPCAEVPDLLSFHLSALSLTQLLSNVLLHHGNQRITQLFEQLLRDSRDQARRVVGAMEMEVLTREEQNKERRPVRTDSVEAAMEKMSLSSPSSPPLVPRSYLVVRLLPGYTVHIHTDMQTGRFVLEWAPVETASGAFQSNLTAMYGALSPLSRLLYAESLRLNQHIAGAFDSMMHIKMACLTMQLGSVCARVPSMDARHRIIPMHVPFTVRAPAGSPATAAAVVEAAKHVLYEPLASDEWRPNHSWQTRAGFGPYTVTLQLSGYSPQYYLLLQLSPYEQLTPKCYFISTEHDPIKKTNGLNVRSALPWLADLRTLQWPLAATPALHDPSEGFSAPSQHAAIASLLAQAESLLPLCLINKELLAKFSHLINATQVCGEEEAAHPPTLMPQLQAIVHARTQQAQQRQQQPSSLSSSSSSSPSSTFPPSASYLLADLHFPLNASIDHPASVLMHSSPGDVHAQPKPRQPAQMIIYAVPPRTFPSSNANNNNSNGGMKNAAATPAGSSSFGFLVYFAHPLLPKLLATAREVDANTAESGKWHRLDAAFSALSALSSSGSSWLQQATSADEGVVTLLYDAIDSQHLSRLIYELDNLYAHLCILSNFLHQSLVSRRGVTSMDDEVMENEVTSATSIRPRPAAPLSSSASYFPADFFRLVELSCNHIVFAYGNPQFHGSADDDDEPPLCTLALSRQHARDMWKRDALVPARLYTSKGSPSPLPPAELVEHSIVQLPVAWPQLPFYTLEFNRLRASSTSPAPILRLLHHVWLAAHSMIPICRFLRDASRWQSLLGIGSVQSWSRQQSAWPTVHCIAESSTRLRMLYGQPSSKMAGHNNMWRNKTDLRLLYENEVVQDFHAGKSIPRAAAATGADDSQPADGDMAVVASNGIGGVSASGVIVPGKISGDLTSYLHRWYKQAFMIDLTRCVKQLEQKAMPLLLPGMRFKLNSGDGADTPNLADPVMRLVIEAAHAVASSSTPASSSSSSSSSSLTLSASELHCVETYFSHRIISPPYITDAFTTFHNLFTLPYSSQTTPAIAQGATNAGAATAAACACVHELIGVWAMELMQAHPLPQPFEQTFDRGMLQSLLPVVEPSSPTAFAAAAAVSSAAPLSFRLVTLLRTPYELDFNAETHMLSFTLECRESRSQAQAGVAPLVRPLCLHLPLAYHVETRQVYRWELNPKHSTSRIFIPLASSPSAPSSSPSSFPSLAHGLQWLLRCSLQQLIEWATAPDATHASQEVATQQPQQQQQPIKKEDSNARGQQQQQQANNTQTALQNAYNNAHAHNASNGNGIASQR